MSPHARCALLCLLVLALALAAGCAKSARRTPPPLSPEEARQRFAQGEAAYHSGMYQASHEAFMAAEAAGYQPAPSLVNAGASLLSMRQSAQALPTLERATREDPASAAAWYNYGLALYGGGKFDDAVRALQQSISLDPANADVWTALGAAFMGKRQPGVAVEQFSRALALDPRNSTILANRAGACLDAALYKEAERDYQAVLALGEDLVIGHLGLGEVYLARKKCRQAEEHFTRAVEFAPANSLAYYNRGMLHRQCGDYVKAEEDFTRAAAFDPEFSEALVMRGDTHLARRQKDLGCKDLIAACDLGNCARLEAVRGAGLCPRLPPL